MSNNDTLQQLAEILEQRKQASESESYVASLYAKGTGTILAKISEEAIETIQAAQELEAADEHGVQHLIHEVADLWFHCMVLLAHKNTSHAAVLEELDARFGISGLVEKDQRSN